MDGAYIYSVMKQLHGKIDRMVEQMGSKTPFYTGADGAYHDVRLSSWVSGFWPAILWITYDMIGDERYKLAAWEWDEKLGRLLAAPDNSLHHDVGFQFLGTAVMKYKITGDVQGKYRGLQAAQFLAGRFNPIGKFIRAWNFDRTGWAIIDCMMNISLLFWASETTKDPRFRHIAELHANTAMKYNVREDGSVNHIIAFDPESGDFIESLAGQGLSANSSWSRGTAWALYGFANVYRYTGNQQYLDTAKRVAHYFIAGLPEDHVPYWDFRLESTTGEPRDSSAAAIAASGLLEIAAAAPEAERSLYTDWAKRILKSLTERYASWNLPEYEGILLHGTGNKPEGSQIDVSLIYGDYYYVEALAKLNGWTNRIY